jgi:hypothetical protein
MFCLFVSVKWKSDLIVCCVFFSTCICVQNKDCIYMHLPFHKLHCIVFFEHCVITCQKKKAHNSIIFYIQTTHIKT